MVSLAFPSPPKSTARYRLRLRVEGANPVTLTGFVDRFDGTAFQAFASGSVVHDANTQPLAGDFCDGGFMPPPLSTAGGAGGAQRTSAHWVLAHVSSNGL